MAPSNRRSTVAATLAWLALLVCGCGDQQKSLRELVARSAELPGALASQNVDLKAEIARIAAEGGTPKQLTEVLLPDEQNVAAAMATIFDRTLLPSILATANGYYPAGRFEFSPVELRRAIEFRNNHRRQLDALIAALARPACDFAVEFDKGFFYEERFVDEVVIACRLLAFDAAAELHKNGPEAALRSLELLFRMVGHLDDVKLLTARVRAAQLRADALRVLEAVAQHKRATKADLESLYRLLIKQTGAWPPDAPMLIGERAMVLHTYEAIRFGLLQWILTPEEKQMFQQERILESLGSVLRETADVDEVFYLQTMRRLIEACNRPYYERLGVFVQLNEDLRALQSKPDYPFAAARLFLPDIESSCEQIAVDRARCEAWALALAAAADLPAPPFTQNPHNGEPYQVTRESLRVVVAFGEPDEPEVVVPLP